VTKGAFEAGVLQVLAQRGIAVERIIAASSGALNGVVYAAGVRARRERAAAAELVSLWENHGGFRDVLHLSLGDILCLRGISDQKNLYALLHGSVLPSNVADPAPIELHLIAAPLRGSEGSTLDEPATTYTKVVSFGGEWFDEQEALNRVLTAATASAALPILYAPVDLPGLGPCVDGGLVANTPIRYAYGEDEGASIDAILVVAATPSFLGQSVRDYRGGNLVAHVVDMLFSEWVYQDLRASRAVNQRLRAVAALAEKKGWSLEEQEETRAALGWEKRHVVPILSIRPITSLPGTLFSGFTDAGIRRQYVASGRERARDVLDRLGWR
jgi:predicted acylesterase/phospholipase RssA